MRLDDEEAATSCRLPISNSEIVKLAHGSGGKLSSSLIESVFLPLLGNDVLNKQDDAADIQIGDLKIAITTDSYVVSPIFFPGGDIGSLAVHGTVNDLTMRGAKPLFLAATFIIEEGFPIADLHRVADSFAQACRSSDVSLLAADTKVVGRGAADKIFVTTTGIGIIACDPVPASDRARAGDVIIVSGDLGLHGMAVMASREGLDLETQIRSDSAPLNKLVLPILQMGYIPRCMRDITRGGLATVLNEIAKSSSVGMLIEENAIPVDPQVSAVCELLGLDPLYVACEGRFVAIMDASCSDQFLATMKGFPQGAQARVIGRVVEEAPGRVVLKSTIGGRRILDKLAGDQLPRIC
ncbi:MAG: hydrogenase expression/formation protein HypE [Candidatus Obscuribacterales bacterium]|jgi:hydrogenase expression/formation protein HypE|nr:hydrogenase expression/formation protein HypE [Candidatus Obscuribacterales bacterium]